LDGVVEERGGELLDFLGPGRGEEERGALGCGRAVREHVADLGLEAHVKHPIGFIKDQVGHLEKKRDNVHKHEKWLTSQKVEYWKKGKGQRAQAREMADQSEDRLYS
jgi:hypothetical protein